jgi:hypothetical protein
MKKIYENIDYTRVGYLQSILESAGISTLLQNAGTSSLSGLIAVGQCYPELWIVDDSELEEAMSILQPHMNFTDFSGAEVEEKN